jgi:hypothetical protein
VMGQAQVEVRRISSSLTAKKMVTAIFDDFRSKDGGHRTEIVPTQFLL